MRFSENWDVCLKFYLEDKVPLKRQVVQRFGSSKLGDTENLSVPHGSKKLSQQEAVSPGKEKGVFVGNAGKTLVPPCAPARLPPGGCQAPPDLGWASA